MAATPLRPERFRLDAVEPAYVVLHRGGGLADRAVAARRALASCSLCPRVCGARRLDGRVGTCGVGRNAVVSTAFPHLGEEDCLRGRRGSGTVFFAGCGLRCAFCQNADVSWLRHGDEHGPEDLAAVFLELQARGCHNLNLVTPSHVVPQVLEALAIAAGRGLRLPLVYNSSGYDSTETLRLLDGVVDVYMPDFKFWRPATAEQYAAASDYPERARAAVLEMHRQAGPLLFGADGLARRGVLVRHLVMPGLVEESSSILGGLAGEVSGDSDVNVMGQYRPEWRVGEPDGAGGRLFEEIDRRPRAWEMEAACEAARRAGLWRFDTRSPAALASGS